jgi:hypothetical protein
MMVALPADKAVTSPLDDTVATEGLVLLHFTALFVALAGLTVAVRVSVLSMRMLALGIFRDTPVTAILPPPSSSSQAIAVIEKIIAIIIMAMPVNFFIFFMLDSFSQFSRLHIPIWRIIRLFSRICFY